MATRARLTEGAGVLHPPGPKSAFGYERDFLKNRFVYLTVSARVHGLSVGINMNPNKLCNFD